jgi:hypothetical protein
MRSLGVDGKEDEGSFKLEGGDGEGGQGYVFGVGLWR